MTCTPYLIPRRLFVMVLALLLGVSSTLAWAEPVAAASELAAAMEERAMFGLPADEQTVREVLTSGLDVGTANWGIPMTSDEEAAIDLVGRMAFADLAARLIVEKAQLLPNFGGAYFDQRDRGALVVLLVGDNPRLEEELASLLPAGTRGVSFGTVQHSYAELEAAAEAVQRAWNAAGARFLNEVSIDTRGNGIVAHVSGVDVPIATSYASQSESDLGIPVDVVLGEPIDLLTCTSRENCADPMRGGVVIHQGSETGPRCTMAFVIANSSNDKQFVTAGHCGYSGSNNWYHQGLPGDGFLGAETATLYPSVLDMMRVQMPNPQASRRIYGNSFDVTSERNPIPGETVCASLGVTNKVDCGTVGNQSQYWDALVGKYFIAYTYSGIIATGGDSGAPFYTVTGSGNIALGTMAGEACLTPTCSTGWFANLHSALAVWGWHLY